MYISTSTIGIVAVGVADVLRSLAEVLVDFPHLLRFEFVPAVLEDTGFTLVRIAGEEV